MSEPLDLEALRQWAEKRDIPYGSQMVRLFPRLCDDLAFACSKLEAATAAFAEIAELHDGPIDADGTESDAWVFAAADDFVTAHGIALAALEALA